MPKNNIYVIVVTFNGESLIKNCLESLRKSNCPVNTVVVDNASEDNTLELVESDFPEVKLLKSGINKGFGFANNIGMKYAYDNSADFIFLLNQDAWIESDTIQNLINISNENPEYYLISPIHLNKQGNDFDKGFRIYTQPPFCKDFTFGSGEELYSTTFVNAAAWMIRRETIKKIGFFDPVFFHYGEDRDYCNRVIFHNKKIGIFTGSVIHHAREKSEVKKTTLRSTLKRKINQNYFLSLIEMKRLDLPVTKLCLNYMWGFLLSSLKNLFRLKINIAFIDFLTLLKLAADVPVIIAHRNECRKTGESFSRSIKLIA